MPIKFIDECVMFTDLTFKYWNTITSKFRPTTSLNCLSFSVVLLVLPYQKIKNADTIVGWYHFVVCVKRSMVFFSVVKHTNGCYQLYQIKCSFDDISCTKLFAVISYSFGPLY